MSPSDQWSVGAMSKHPEDRYTSPADMVEAVYGSQHIQNSVVAFNPQELTMVAQRVAGQAEKIAIGGGDAGSEPYGRPIGFESDDASAWKRGADIGGEVLRPDRASQDTDAPADTIAQPATEKRVHWYAPDTGPELVKDRMPAVLRYGLGIVVACAPSALSGPNEDHFGYSLLIIGVTVALVWLLRETQLRKMSIKSQAVPRLMVSAVLLAAVPPVVFLLGGSDGMFPSVEFVIAGLLPLVLVNIHRLTHARRRRRFEIPPVAFVGLAALALSACFGPSTFTLVPVAVAVGTMMSLQIMSPMRRVAR